MPDLKQLSDMVVKFRDDRDWAKFHNAKEIAIDIAVEASELLEHFQWKQSAELEDYIEAHREDIQDELADVLYGVLLFAHDQKIDLAKALEEKLHKTAIRYPIDKAKGSHKKYTEL